MIDLSWREVTVIFFFFLTVILTSFTFLTDANPRKIDTKILIFDRNLLNISDVAMRYL